MALQGQVLLTTSSLELCPIWHLFLPTEYSAFKYRLSFAKTLLDIVHAILKLDYNDWVLVRIRSLALWRAGQGHPNECRSHRVPISIVG